ncbi:hypothetical protein C2845_PM14G07190 [Panicum miliaceum]|uniref:Uncharacterized protein n=1 Tax=Panicum miliaceum TaxID=4540 RepID=A0A3L6PPM0_PANMI|nr:hypothetical protein C2845_PM14G07190 [Panicum miliaceum]
MWNPIKKTLKKISSTSSSRHSQSSASSRDNMSVDSSRRTCVSQKDTTPVVPRNRIRICISVLTMGHLMREGPANSLFMCYPGYDKEVELPCPRVSLYLVKRLTLQMEKEPAH